MKAYHILYCFILSLSIYAQDFSKEALQKLKDEELLTLFDQVDADSIKAEKVARIYLNRARKEKDTIKMARGYDRLARIFHHEKNIQFADSIIYLTKDFDHITYPGLGFLLKGLEFGKVNNFKLEISNYLAAYDLALKNNNIIQKLFLSNKLLYSKAIWGNKRDALRLQTERHKLLNSKEYYINVKKATRSPSKNNINETHMYDQLFSLHNFVFCYLNLKVLDSARIYLNKGLELSEKYNYNKTNKVFYNWFIESSIEIDYYDEEYLSSIKSSDSLLNMLDIYKNTRSIQNIYLFKGLSLLKLDDYDTGIEYLKKSDSIFEANNFSVTQPYQRILFEKLLDHYQFKNNTEQRIRYLNKLIAADTIIIKNYKFFEPNLIREFETPQLIKEKEILITSLELKNKNKSYTIIWVIGLLSICLIVLGYYINRQQVYKKRFNSLVSKNGSKNKDKVGERVKNEISKEIFSAILEQLDNFEKKKLYLSTQISLQGMAKSFGTNYNYLSRIINFNEGKRFSSYINDLRVEYAFKELKEDSKLKNYTIKAIAKECGFKSAESFSKSFLKKYGFTPSFYLNQLDKKNNKD